MPELCSFLCLKLYSLNFAIAHAQIDCYAYQNSPYLCCINAQEYCLITWNKLRNQFRIYQFSKKIVNSLPLTKTNREYQIFGYLRFITISITFFLLLNQVDLSAHCSYHFSTRNVLRLRWKFGSLLLNTRPIGPSVAKHIRHITNAVTADWCHNYIQ